ncbi:TspO/MBR family protein [Peribacillus castrilensis]|uniref:TspO/MBR family protein n=1 Tax=Bacillaceae TaxID=186817 RepID=UPI001D04A740|nr:MULTISPECIES: TspO/MBR family protein [Bacillaceae]MCF7624924.1 tryptophan-rich sensory protein [Peribacillus frigoritolerans]MCP1095536.1 tryptophan-rich sensory protein [Bacillaceae bacterium OS4b]MEA3574189.1 TspO/MBR family protein [Peribacillus frigoritolerans]
MYWYLSLVVHLWGYSPQGDSKGIYDKLKKPAFAPPSWTFPVAWTSLYTIMGIAKYRIASKEKESKSAELLYDTQLGLNFLWSFLFFKWGLRGTAFIEMAALLTLITLTAFEFYKIDRTSGLASETINHKKERTLY